ncbi:MAG: Swt1 family HEPN domain-containing protein [Candidatus Thorarchaeota archaeon]
MNPPIKAEQLLEEHNRLFDELIKIPRTRRIHYRIDRKNGNLLGKPRFKPPKYAWSSGIFIQLQDHLQKIWDYLETSSYGIDDAIKVLIHRDERRSSKKSVIFLLEQDVYSTDEVYGDYLIEKTAIGVVISHYRRNQRRRQFKIPARTDAEIEEWICDNARQQIADQFSYLWKNLENEIMACMSYQQAALSKKIDRTTWNKAAIETRIFRNNLTVPDFNRARNYLQNYITEFMNFENHLRGRKVKELDSSSFEEVISVFSDFEDAGEEVRSRLKAISSGTVPWRQNSRKASEGQEKKELIDELNETLSRVKSKRQNLYEEWRIKHSKRQPAQIQETLGQNQADYSILQDLEQTLRIFIITKLEARYGEKWWQQGIPNDIRQKCQERKEKNEKPYPWSEDKEHRLLDYADFSDYAKIIEKKDNWHEVFKPIIRDKNTFVTKLRELEPIRNDISHSRSLDDMQKDTLTLYARQIKTTIQ